MPLVLASKSPRRRDLLKMAGIDNFLVITGDDDELEPLGLSPEQTVCEIALGKAKSALRLCGEDDTIIAADTLVYLDGNPLGKPGNTDEAMSMLRALSGRRHSVYTGVAILKGKTRSVFAEVTDVFFRVMTDEEITSYIATGEPMDKAGAYGAQGKGAMFIERIEGDFFNVMGLPLCRLSLTLKNLGV